MRKKIEKEFDLIFWENKDFVFNMARRYFNEHDADDVLQEVFIKIYVNYKKFRGESNIRTWIYRITLNEVYTRLKKIKKEREVNYFLNEDNNNEIRLDEIVDIIKTMPSKRAKIMMLRGIDNLDFRTISEIVGITVESAKSLYSLGVKEMRNKLGINKAKEVFYGEGLE